MSVKICDEAKTSKGWRHCRVSICVFKTDGRFCVFLCFVSLSVRSYEEALCSDPPPTHPNIIKIPNRLDVGVSAEERVQTLGALVFMSIVYGYVYFVKCVYHCTYFLINLCGSISGSCTMVYQLCTILSNIFSSKWGCVNEHNFVVLLRVEIWMRLN